MSEQPVLETSPGTSLTKFLNGEKIDVANVAVLQLTRMSVVKAVHPCPIGIRNRAKERANKANGIVDLPLPKEGIVPTIMLDDEDADQEEGIDHAKQQGEPDRIVYTKIHGDP